METKTFKCKLLTYKNSLITRYNNMKKRPANMNLSSFDVLFDIKTDTAQFRNEEDRLFYLDQNQKRVATLGIPDRLDNEKILSNKARYSRDKQKDACRRCKKQKLEVTDYPINEKRHTR